jgi:hypothetical protein
LGELTNELDSDDFIVEGVFPGPKNYGYITHKGKSMCKVKGFSLNYKAGEKVNFKSMKNMILNELGQNSKIVAEQRLSIIIILNGKIFSIKKKNYCAVFKFS